MRRIPRCKKRADGKHILGGTGFLVAHSYGIEAESPSYVYLVTAKHVIDGIKGLGVDRVYLRLNFKSGDARWIHSEISSWRFHPTDPTVDVAICPIVNLPRELDHSTYPVGAIGSQNTLKVNGVGLGDEVFITGLFSHHSGRSKNIPIVRAGNIAAMPEERIYSEKFGMMEAYLIEVRSIGGISGSPVFAYLGPTRMRGPRRTPDGNADSRFFLFGLIHGHFDEIAQAQDEVVEDTGKPVSLNVGIAIVVPGEKIMEVIEHPDFKKARAESEKNFRDQRSPTMDSLDQPEQPFTKEDFEAALKKVSRRIQPSQSDEEK